MSHMVSIRAREELALMECIGAAFSGGDSDWRVEKARIAFRDDPDALAVVLEAYTRK